MDELTKRFYASRATELAVRYDSVRGEVERNLRRSFVEGMRVLDIGAGSGRDMVLLSTLGCEAFGVEPTDELRFAAIARHPELEGRLERGEIPDLGSPFGGRFDGVLCSAVLMHLPRAQILDAAIAIRSVLKENGRLLISVPANRPDIDQEGRDARGRLFTRLAPDYLRLLFERIGFVLIDKWDSEDSLGRTGDSWSNLLLQLRHPTASGPLDQIEGILNRDRKTATYKLALFRALGEIAMTSFEQARWIDDGTVGVPVAAVSEKWLYYYWPMFESSVFIPQIRGEAPDCRKPVAFRASLSRLVEMYRMVGGLSRFVLDFRNKVLPEEAASLLSVALNQIQNTVVKGPVTYAGGSLESGRIFQYDTQRREIRMQADLWRELSLVGRWIQDAVILRWAELTHDISQQSVRVSAVVDLLLAEPVPERDVSDARKAYDAARVSKCTWTDSPLRGGYDVDHVLPFSLWRNNDLWNLVPASHAVNISKSDRLPTRNLLLSRKGRIIECWKILRDSHRARFDHEACQLAGLTTLPSVWGDLVFGCVADSVEFTAAQRGCERWQPR